MPGLVGLGAVSVASLLSPTGFCGLPLFVLVPLGFSGLVVCAIGLAFKPRWPAVVGLVVGIGTLAFWALFFVWPWWSIHSSASRLGLNFIQHTQMQMAAISLADAAEGKRQSDGSPPTTIDLQALSASETIDPWGRPYRYVLMPTARGFTFISDGPDGTAGTPDDIDLFTLQKDETFSLPPISPTAKPPLVPPSGP